MKFAVITPTIGRSNLSGTLNTIYSAVRISPAVKIQSIIVVDGLEHRRAVESAVNTEVTKFQDFTDRLNVNVYTLPIRTNNFGNTPRHVAYYFLEPDVDYILYLDDDDMYIGGGLATLAVALESLSMPDWAVFPALRFNSIFYNKPAGSCMTVSCQFAHKPTVEGNKVQWFEDAGYCADGVLIDFLGKIKEPLYLDQCPPLCNIDRISHGQ